MKDMHVLWIGVLAGMVVAALAPGWLKAVAFVIALVFSGLLVRLRMLPHQHPHFHLTVPPLLIAAGAVAFAGFAWHYARKRGLAHLGEAELNTRWEHVRRMSRWGL